MFINKYHFLAFKISKREILINHNYIILIKIKIKDK
jgi:hypothetical protein